MLNRYFIRPLFWDYTIAACLAIIIFELYSKGLLNLPNTNNTLSTVTDLSTIALTLAGFILTLLTVLITFKSGSKVTKNSYTDDNSSFEIFFASNFYFETVKHLKNCIKSLIAISIIGFSLKLLLDEKLQQYVFFFNVIGLIILGLTLWRSLFILVKIIDLQKDNDG